MMIGQASDDTGFQAMRQAMVASQLRTNAVDDPRIVTAMARVPREAFVPAEAAAIAYRDTAIPLGAGRSLNPPMATGKLLVAAAIRPADAVLLVGAASGYTAALLSRLAARVVAVESDAALATAARTSLAGDARVRVVEGPLAAGAPDAAPFDVLVVDGAVERLPDALVDQLRPGGRIACGIVERGVTRLCAGQRTEGGIGLRPFADVECVVLPGFETPKSFRF